MHFEVSRLVYISKLNWRTKKAESDEVRLC